MARRKAATPSGASTSTSSGSAVNRRTAPWTSTRARAATHGENPTLDAAWRFPGLVAAGVDAVVTAEGEVVTATITVADAPLGSVAVVAGELVVTWQDDCAGP